MQPEASRRVRGLAPGMARTHDNDIKPFIHSHLPTQKRSKM